MKTMNKNNWLKGLFITALVGSQMGVVQADVWPQSENSYMPTTKSPNWIENRAPQQQQMMPQYAPQQQYYGQPAPYAMPRQPMPYTAGPRNGYPGEPGYGYNRGNAQPFNWSTMPTMPNAPYMATPSWGNGSWPSMPNMNMSPNMPSMPNMNHFPSPSMPNMDMPSPSFNMPTMSMPFFN